jgi:hypothetical protein
MKSIKWVVAYVICVAAFAMAGCAAPIVHARQAITAAAALGTQAGNLYVAVDDQQQQAIARQLQVDRDVAKAEASRDAWRAKQATALRALKVYSATVSSLGAFAEIRTPFLKTDLGELLKGLAKAYGSLKDVLASFGVAVPGVN